MKGVDGKTFESINPTNEKPIVAVHEATEKDVDIAVSAARKAFEGEWRKVDPGTRGRYLTNLADLMEKHAKTLAAIESLDNGKAVSMANIDVTLSAGCIRYYGGWSDKIHGKVIEKDSDSFNYTKQEPVCPYLLPLVSRSQVYGIFRSVFALRSSRGTFLSSCGHGRLAQPSLAVTRS